MKKMLKRFMISKDSQVFLFGVVLILLCISIAQTVLVFKIHYLIQSIALAIMLVFIGNESLKYESLLSEYMDLAVSCQKLNNIINTKKSTEPLGDYGVFDFPVDMEGMVVDATEEEDDA